MATNLVENRTFVGLVAVLAVLAVAAPYFTSQGFAVAGGKDLTITSVDVPQAQHNVPFNAKVTFANIGSTWATRVTYKYELWNAYNLVYANVGVVSSLGAGQQQAVSLPVEEQIAGAYTLRILVDSEYEHTESNENNNALVTSVTIV